MQFNNITFGKCAEPFRYGPFVYNYQFPSAPVTELLMITETDDIMITETTNENMATE